MGMFDKEVQLKNAPFFDDKDGFMLWEGTFIGAHTSADYGEGVKARVVAGPDREEYIVFGVLAEQIGRMNNGDLPAKVKVEKDGRANVFVKVEE